jgi:hypothetical protein
MAKSNYELLSFQDNGFLQAETSNLHMHVSSTLVFESGPLATEEGGLDAQAIKESIVDVLHRIPRYRQRLHWVPLENRAVWVDDPHFDGAAPARNGGAAQDPVRTDHVAAARPQAAALGELGRRRRRRR